MEHDYEQRRQACAFDNSVCDVPGEQNSSEPIRVVVEQDSKL